MKRQIIIPGEPQGKGRPRFARMGKFTRTYTPRKTHDYELAVQIAYANAYAGEEPAPKGTPVCVEIEALYGIPKSASKAKREAMICGNIRPLKKVDIDNLIKIILDSLNGVAWEDDVQVVQVAAEKWYSEEPKVVVRIITEEEAQ